MPRQDFNQLFATNLTSAFRLTQLCFPLLKAAGKSCMLLNSSVAGGPTAMRCVLPACQCLEPELRGYGV